MRQSWMSAPTPSVNSSHAHDIHEPNHFLWEQLVFHSLVYRAGDSVEQGPGPRLSQMVEKLCSDTVLLLFCFVFFSSYCISLLATLPSPKLLFFICAQRNIIISTLTSGPLLTKSFILISASLPAFPRPLSLLCCLTSSLSEASGKMLLGGVHQQHMLHSLSRIHSQAS